MADQKITQLSEQTSPDNTDILPTVVDLSGTPTTKKISWTNVKAFLKTYFDTLYGAGGGTDMFDTALITFSHAVTKVMCLTSTSGGAVNEASTNGKGIEITTGGTNGDYAYAFVYSGGLGNAGFSKTSHKIRFFISSMPATANKRFTIYYGHGANPSYDNYASMMFWWEGTTLKMRTANSSGTTTDTDVTSSAGTWNDDTQHIVDLVFTKNTNVKGYIDGTLVATHTTNIPNSTTGYTGYGIRAQSLSTAASKTAYWQYAVWQRTM